MEQDHTKFTNFVRDSLLSIFSLPLKINACVDIIYYRIWFNLTGDTPKYLVEAKIVTPNWRYLGEGFYNCQEDISYTIKNQSHCNIEFEFIPSGYPEWDEQSIDRTLIDVCGFQKLTPPIRVPSQN